MKNWRWLSLAGLFSLALNGYISYRNRTSLSWDFNSLRLAALFLLFSASFYFHNKDYHSKNFHSARQIGNEKNHIWCYDYLRIIAVILVISVHTFDKAAVFAEPESFMAYTLLSASALCLICNQLYVMISGALLLGKGKVNLGSFYWNRFLKAVVPLVCYYFIYKAVHGGLQNLYPANLPQLFLQIISGPFDGAPHLWLIYVILSLYLIAPFLSIMMIHLPSKMQKGLIWLILLSQAASVYLPYLRFSPGIHFILSSWEGVFIMGYFLSGPDSARFRRPLLAAGLASAALTVWGMVTLKETALFVNTAPTMTFMAGAVFAGLFYRNDRLKAPGIILSAISKYSYSIILIHWYVLYYLVGDRFFAVLGSGNVSILAGCAVTIAAVLLFSFMTAWVYDYVVVFLFQSVLSYLPRLVKGLK